WFLNQVESTQRRALLSTPPAPSARGRITGPWYKLYSGVRPPGFAGKRVSLPIWKGVFMLVDNFSRRFTYLRLSVTEACNFRCNYCLPQGTDCSTSKRAQELTLPEIENLVRAFARLGTRKIRITGGEPSL